MKRIVFKVKFGEETEDGSYTDDIKLSAFSLAEAATAAENYGKMQAAISMSDFQFDPKAEGSKAKQRLDWNANARASWTPTSIIFEGILEA